MFFMCAFEYFIHGITICYFVFFKCYVIEHLWNFNLFIVCFWVCVAFAGRWVCRLNEVFFLRGRRLRLGNRTKECCTGPRTGSGGIRSGGTGANTLLLGIGLPKIL